MVISEGQSVDYKQGSPVRLLNSFHSLDQTGCLSMKILRLEDDACVFFGKIEFSVDKS